MEAAWLFVRGPGKPETGQAASKPAGGRGGLASCEKWAWGLCSEQLLLEPQSPHLCTRMAVTTQALPGDVGTTEAWRTQLQGCQELSITELTP